MCVGWIGGLCGLQESLSMWRGRYGCIIGGIAIIHVLQVCSNCNVCSFLHLISVFLFSFLLAIGG